MSGALRATILGCGSSGGVPRLGGYWGACDPGEPRNLRRRCALLVERIGLRGVTRVLIDTTPDLRAQLLDAGVGLLDGVVYTHSHADHMHGIDDLRQIVFNRGSCLPVYADAPTQAALLDRFAYVFVQPEGSLYPPILQLETIEGPFVIDGPGGPIPFQPFTVNHGPTDALGFRIGGLAYLPDVLTIPESVWPLLAGLDLWILDALGRKPHPTHVHLDLALQWIARVQPKAALLTNMHLEMDYATLCTELPADVRPAYDGLTLTLPAP